MAHRGEHRGAGHFLEELGGEEKGRDTNILEVAFASYIGTAIEWYDFLL